MPSDAKRRKAEKKKSANIERQKQYKKPQKKADKESVADTTEYKAIVSNSNGALQETETASRTEAIRSKDPDDLLNFLGQLRPELRNENEPRLLANCKSLNLKPHGSTPADGNCFFHAVADQLSLMGNLNRSATDLRHDLVQFLRSHQTLEGPDGVVDLKGMVTKDWSTYCSEMGKDKEWVDAPAVFAMAHMLKKNIRIVTSSPQVTKEKCFLEIDGAPSPEDRALILGHVHESHYESLVADDGPAARHGKMLEPPISSSSFVASPAGNKTSNPGNKTSGPDGKAERHGEVHKSRSSVRASPVGKSTSNPDGKAERHGEVHKSHSPVVASPVGKSTSNPDDPAEKYGEMCKSRKSYASAVKTTPDKTPVVKRKPEEVKIEVLKGSQEEQKEKSRQDIASATQQVLESYFQNEEYKNRQKAEMCLHKVKEILSIFVEKDFFKQNGHSASTRDITPVLDFLLHCPKFETEEFDGLRKSADKVRKNRNDFVHNYRSEPILPTKILNNYKKDMVELLKNKKLPTGKADEARNFIEQACKVNFVISLEDDLKAKISTIQALMVKLQEKHTTDMSDLKKQMAEMEDQIDELTGKLDEFQKSKDHVAVNLTEEEQENCRLLLIKAYESKETIPNSPLLDTGIDLQDLYTDIDMKVIEKGNKEKSQNVSLSEIFRKGDQVTRVVIQGAAGFGKSTSGRKILSNWCCAHKDRQNSVSGDGSSNSTQHRDFKDVNVMLRFDLLLYLDVNKVSSESNLLDAFFNQFPLVERNKQEEDHPYKHYFVSLITQAKDNKVLLILDGLDDLKTSITFIEQIMRRELYPSLTVLALTRPWKIEQMQLNQPAHIDLLLDLKGFSLSNSRKFAEKILVSYCSGKEKFDICSFSNDVKKNKVMKGLIHIPLLLLFLVCLWCEDNKMTFPHTTHEVYLEIFDMLVRRGMKQKIKLKNKEGPDEKEKKCLPLENAAFSSVPKIKNMLLVKEFGEDCLNALCDVAYQFLSKDQKENSCVFEEEQFVKLFGKDGESKLQTALELGFLSKSESPGGLHIKTNVRFLHKTVQEFLAAIGICCRPDRFDTFLSTLKTFDDVFKNENVIMFTAGISTSHCTKISEKICQIVYPNTQLNIIYSITRLYINCIREARDMKNWLNMPFLFSCSEKIWNVLLSVLRSGDDVRVIELRSKRSQKLEIFQLDPHMYPNLSEIYLTAVIMNDVELNFSDLTYLTEFSLKEATLNGRSKLILSKCNQLQRVFLRHIEGTNENEIMLSECRTLEELYVGNIRTCTLDLSESTSLTKLTLIDFFVTSKSKLVLPVLPQLGKLVLSNVSLENFNVKSNCLTELVLADVTVTNEGKLILPELTQLKSILACNVSINTSLLDLSGSTSLTKVMLYNVTLNSDGQMMLSGFQQLTHLKLKNLKMKDLSLDLTECSSLTELILLNITGTVKMTWSKCTKLSLLELKTLNLNDFVLQDPCNLHLTSCIIDNVQMSVNWTQNLLQCVNLKTIMIQHVNMGDAELDLSLCTYLTDLTLIDLTITSDGMRHLFESLSSCKQLESLTLCKFNLSRTPLENDMLERLKSLKCFSLENLGNTLDLSKCTCLKYLELDEVTMASDGMALFENMSHCSHLEILKLDCLDLTTTLLEMDIFKRFKLLFMTNITISSRFAAQIQNYPEIGSCVTVEESSDMVTYVVTYHGGSEYCEYHDYVEGPFPYTDEEIIGIELYEETGEMHLDLIK